MASQNLLVLVLLCVMAASVSAGQLYLAGGSSGWGLDSNIQPLYVSAGDAVQFNYDSSMHTVCEVSQEAFDNCDASAPWSEYTDGSDSIEYNSEGVHYYICSKAGHCSAGMKLTVFVQQ